MVKVTRWSPDTCACVIEYSWDTDTPQDQRTHSVHRILTACQAHEGKEKSDHFNSVLGENQKKNKIFGEIAKTISDFANIDQNGNKNPDLNKLSFEFDAERNLVVKALGAKQSHMALIRRIMDEHQTPGKGQVLNG